MTRDNMAPDWVDITAVAFFAIEWLVYAITLEHNACGRDSLSAHARLSRGLGPKPAGSRDAPGRYADHGVAAKRHGLFRLHQPDRARRRTGAIVRQFASNAWRAMGK